MLPQMRWIDCWRAVDQLPKPTRGLGGLSRPSPSSPCSAALDHCDIHPVAIDSPFTHYVFVVVILLFFSNLPPNTTFAQPVTPPRVARTPPRPSPPEPDPCPSLQASACPRTPHPSAAAAWACACVSRCTGRIPARAQLAVRRRVGRQSWAGRRLGWRRGADGAAVSSVWGLGTALRNSHQSPLRPPQSSPSTSSTPSTPPDPSGRCTPSRACDPANRLLTPYRPLPSVM